MQKSASSQVARAASLIMIISVVGKLLGFVREQVIASQFGATGQTDAYIAALTVPTMLVALIGGTIGMAFLPVFSNYMARGDEKRSWGLLGVIFRLTLTLLILVAVIGVLAAPLIAKLLVPSFSVEQQALTVSMLRIMLPGAVYLGLTALFASLLNSFKQFGWPAIGPLAMNVGIISIAWLLKDSLGVIGLAWATLAGMAIQLILLGWRVRQNGFPLLRRANANHPGIRQVGSLAYPIVVGTLFGQVYTLVDKGLASGLDAGSIAALNYAQKLVQLPVGVFVTALATAIYPTLADFAGNGDRVGLTRTVGSGIRLLALIMLPSTVGLVVLRFPIVRLAFERGSFDATATSQTAIALAFYALGLLGVAAVQVLSRAFYSMQDSITPVKVAIGTALLNIGLAVVLVKPMRHGGLALANSLAVLTNMAVLMLLFSRKLQVKLGFIGSVLKIGLASALMGITVGVSYPALQRFGVVLSLGGAVGLGIVVYGALVILLGVEEAVQLLVIIKRRLGLSRIGSMEEAA